MVFKRRKKRVTILKKQAMVLMMEVKNKRNKSQAKKRAMTAMRRVTMMKSKKKNRKRWKKKLRETKRQKRFRLSAKQSLSQMPARRNKPKHTRSLTTWRKSLSARKR